MLFRSNKRQMVKNRILKMKQEMREFKTQMKNNQIPKWKIWMEKVKNKLKTIFQKLRNFIK